MVSSWLSADTKKTRETSGKVAPITSLLRSLNLNRTRLASSLTFRDTLGIDKSVCEIVSRVSNCVDVEERKTARTKLDTSKIDSQECWEVNSRTESAIQNQSSTSCTSIRINDRNNVKDDKASENFALLSYSPKLVEIYSGNRGAIFKRASLNAESLETIRRWGSAKCFSSKIGDDTHSTVSHTTRKKVFPSSCTTSNAAQTINFDNKLQLTSLDNDNTTRASLNQRKIERVPHNTATIPSEFNQDSERGRQQVQRNSVKNKTQLSLDCKEKSADKSPAEVAKKIDERKSNEENNENPCHRIHLSINNYFNSPHESPLISPKTSGLHGELTSKGYRARKTVGTERKSIVNTRGKQEIKRISATGLVGENRARDFCEVLTQVDVKITASQELSDDNSKNNTRDGDLKLSMHPRIVEDCEKLKPKDILAKSSVRKNTKINCLQNQFSAVLTGQHKTVAKPSKMLIPQSSRARALFEPLANIQESLDSKMQFSKSRSEKRTCRTEKLSTLPGITKSGNNNSQKDEKNNRHDVAPTYPVWKLCGLKKPIPPKYSSHPTTVHHSKMRDKVLQSSPLNLRSQTFISESTADLTFGQNNDSQKETKQSDGVIEDKRFSNKHSKSLRMLKEIISFEEDNHPKESQKETKQSNGVIEDKRLSNKNSQFLRMLKEIISFEEDHHSKEGSSEISDESVNQSWYDTKHSNMWLNEAFIKATARRQKAIFKKAMNNVESQTNVKSEKSQSLQTISEAIERLDAYTETDADISCDDLMSVSTYCMNETLVDVQVSCSLPTIASSDEKLFRDPVKSYRVRETQTSNTSIQYIKEEKKDMSVETMRVEFHCKQVNTERQPVIDSVTGKDGLEVQNFCCDSQFTTTASSVFESRSIHQLKMRVNNVESQVHALSSVISIGIEKMSTDILVGFNDPTISALTNKLMPPKRSLVERQIKFTNDCDMHQRMVGIPDEVIRAFEIATQRAQNLHKAIEIYQENELKRREEFKVLTEEYRNEIRVVNLLEEREQESKSLIVALKQITESEKVLQAGLHELVLQQEVQITLETLLDQIEEKINRCEERKKCDIKIKNVHSTNSQVICKTSWTQSSISREKILPIIYLSVCTLIFWLLQFSTSCEIG